jgi:hypothetical protein
MARKGNNQLAEFLSREGNNVEAGQLTQLLASRCAIRRRATARSASRSLSTAPLRFSRPNRHLLRGLCCVSSWS